jgi:cytochrome c oxidase assembly factor CtaG
VPALGIVVAAAVLYWLGGRRRQGRAHRGRTIAFVLALVAIVAALDAPHVLLAD